MVTARLAALLAVLALAVSGCAVLRPAGPAPGPSAVIDAQSGLAIDPKALASDLAQARVVVVGEHHAHPEHHRVQLEALEMMERKTGPLVVVVEWLDLTAQPQCDRLSAGEITVEQFAAEVDWKKRWGYPLSLYAPILERVRAQGHRLVAGNAPLTVIRQLAHNGLESLTPAQRGQLAPAMDLSSGTYRQRLRMASMAHGIKDPKSVENFIIAQIARDETMAHRLAQAMIPWPDGDRRAILFAGGGHLAHGQGIIPRIQRRLPGVKVVSVLPVSSDSGRLAGYHQGGPAPADYLVITGPAPAGRPRLGIIIKPASGGLLVHRVFPGTPAEAGGLKAGDLLISVDGVPLTRTKGIHDAIAKTPRAPHKYQVQRGGKTIELTITIGRPAPAPAAR